MQYSGMVFCSLIQSMVRTIICSVFLHRFLILLEYPRAAKATFIAYIVTLLSFDIFEAVDIFIEADRISCDGDNHWQIYTLISVDSIQSLILIITSVITYKSNEMRRRSKSVLSSGGSNFSCSISDRFEY